MPLDGNGNWIPPSPEFPAVGGNVIKSAEFNAIINDIKAAFSTVFYRDGQTVPTQNLPMGSKKLTGLLDGINPADSCTYGQMMLTLAALVATNTPLMDGVTASKGVSSKLALEDHVHPLSIPVGSIIAWMGGRFANNSNGGFVNILGNTIADANAYLNPLGWFVCDGSALQVDGSPVFTPAGWYLPNISDSRFILGYNAAGAVGGNNSDDHTHAIPHTHTIPHAHSISHIHYMDHVHSTNYHYLTIAEIPAHSHNYYMKTTTGGSSAGGDAQSIGLALFDSGITGGGGGHEHGNTNNASIANTYGPDNVYSGGTNTANSSGTNTANSAGASAHDNRPLFLTCFYIIKVK